MSKQGVYNAFISYSRTADEQLGEALRSALTQFAKPWYQLRALHIFLDRANLPINSRLWSLVKDALDASEYFLLLASTESATSKWVERELRYWLTTSSSKNILIVLTEGEIAWDDGTCDFDWARTTALSTVLRQAFSEEPLYIDLRSTAQRNVLSPIDPDFQDAVAAVAAELLGRSKDDLISEEKTQHRRARMMVRLAIAGLGLLIAVGYFGAHQMVLAKRRHYVFVAQELAAQALRDRDQGKHDERAALLARQAFLLNQEKGLNIISQIDNALRGVLSVPYFNSVLGNHESNVSSVAFSPDGIHLASGGRDSTVRVWDLGNPGSEPLVLRGHTSHVNSVAFRPDGNFLASAADDGTVRVWDLENKSVEPRIIFTFNANFRSVAISPDGTRIAAGRIPPAIELHDLEHPDTRPTILKNQGARAVAFSPDGTKLASDGSKHTIRLWKLDDLESEPTILREHEGPITAVTFSPDNRTLASADSHGTIRLWDSNNPRDSKAVLHGHQLPIESLAFGPDGTMLASGGFDPEIRLWHTGQPEKNAILIPVPGGAISSVAFSPDGSTLASGQQDGTIRLWDLAYPTAARIVLGDHKSKVTAVAYSPKGQTLASGGFDKVIRLWDANNYKASPVLLRAHDGWVTSLAFSPDGRILASGSEDHTIRIWDVRHASVLNILPINDGGVVSVAFSPDGKTLASGSYDHRIRLWNLAKPTAEPTVIQHHVSGGKSVLFSPLGSLLVSVTGRHYHQLSLGNDRTVRLWDIRHPTAAPTILRGHNSVVFSAAFSPDGNGLATGSSDATIRLWSTAKVEGKQPVLTGHGQGVTSVVFSTDGKTLASGSFDGTIRLWNIPYRSQKPIVLRGHKPDFISLSFSPDGTSLASGSGDGTVSIWITRTRILADAVCDKVRRNLTHEEWRRFVGEQIPYERTCDNLPEGRSLRDEGVTIDAR